MFKSSMYVVLLCLVHQVIVAQINLSQKLVAYYPFKGNANDASFNTNNGTVNGATLTTDRFGSSNSAYYFNGSNTIEINSSKIAAKEFSYAAWVYPNVLPGSGTAVTIFATGSLGGDSFYGLFRDFYGLSGFGMFSYSAPGNVAGTIQGFTPTLNQWYHIVFVRDVSRLYLYINGSLALQVAHNSSNSYYGEGPVKSFIGGRGSLYNWQGKIDDVHLYNRALTVQDVQALYQGQNGLELLLANVCSKTDCGENQIVCDVITNAGESNYTAQVAAIGSNDFQDVITSVNGGRITAQIPGYLNNAGTLQLRVVNSAYALISLPVIVKVSTTP